MTLRDFVPRDPWMFYLWHVGDGRNIMRTLQPTRSWESVKAEAVGPNNGGVPNELLRRKRKWLFLLFLVFVPHRLTSASIRLAGRDGFCYF